MDISPSSRAYVSVYEIPVTLSDIRANALQWAVERGNRSGRTAFQYITHLAAENEHQD